MNQQSTSANVIHTYMYIHTYMPTNSHARPQCLGQLGRYVIAVSTIRDESWCMCPGLY